MNRILIIALLIALCFSSCRTHQIIIEKNHKIIDEVNNDFEFEWLKAKAKIEFQQREVHQNLALHLKIRSDSVIWGSLSAVLGFEIARFNITKDTFQFIDRINKKYFTGSLDYIYKIFPFIEIEIFSALENLIMNNAIFKVDESFDIAEEGNITTFSKKDPHYNKTIYVHNNNFHISGYLIDNKMLNQRLKIDYSGKINDGSIVIPQNIEIKAFMGSENTINLNLTNIHFNKPFKFNFSIPDSYERMD